MFKNCYRCCLFYFGFGRRTDDVGLNLGLLENGNSVAGSTEHYTVQKISRLVFISLYEFRITKNKIDKSTPIVIENQHWNIDYLELDIN